jgi:hypothetical protein
LYKIIIEGKRMMKLRSFVVAVMICLIWHTAYAMDNQKSSMNRATILQNWWNYRVPLSKEVAARHDVAKWHQDLFFAVVGKNDSRVRRMIEHAGNDAVELVSTGYYAYGNIFEAIHQSSQQDKMKDIILPYMRLDVLKSCFEKRLLMVREDWQTSEKRGEGMAVDPMSESILVSLYRYNPEVFSLSQDELKNLKLN